MVQASPEIWDEVARHFAREIAPAERELVGEIAGVLNGIGLLPPARLIEVGAGSGHLSLLLHEWGYDTTLLDFSPVALEHARAMYAAHGHGDKAAAAESDRFIQGDAFDLLRMPLGGFDLAWNSGVCEHFDAARLERMLRGMAAIASKVLVIVPNPESVFYLAGRRRAAAQNSWPYGVELLRRTYEEIFRAAGLMQIGHGFMARGMSRDWIRLAVGAEAAPLFEGLLDEEQMPSRELYLQYFIGKSEPDLMRQDETASLHTKDMDGDAFDRTFSLDALGTAMAALAKTQQEADRLKVDAAEAKELRERLQSARDGLAIEREAAAAARAALAKMQEETERLKVDAAEAKELRERLQSAWDGLATEREAAAAARAGWRALHATALQLRNACLAWQARALDLEASTSWRITAPLRRLQLMRQGRHTLPTFDPPHIPELVPLPDGPVAGEAIMPLRVGQPGTLDAHIQAMHMRLASAARRGLTIVTCGFDFDVSVNQRPINLALEAAASGHSVVFVAWEWEPDQPSPFRNQLFEGNILQVGRFDFIRRPELFKGLVGAVEESVYILSVPSRDLCDAQHALRGAGCAIVYDVMDDWEGFAAIGQAPWFERPVEENVVLSADVVTAVSPPLAAKFASLRQDVALVPNGFSPRLLGERPMCGAPQKEGETVKIGYFGHLTDAWFDWPLIFDTLESAPDIEMEVIGYGEPDWVRQKAAAQPRLRLLGKRPPSELAEHAIHWHVAIIPFKRGMLAEAVDPIKIYEYLYFRLPVVVTGIAHVASYPATSVAQDVRSFVDALYRAGRGARADIDTVDSFHVAQPLSHAASPRV
jgi:SAM-dependent methyltransferase